MLEWESERVHARDGGAARFVVVLTVCLVAILAAGVLAIRYIVIDSPIDAGERVVRSGYEAAREVARDIRKAFQFTPTVVINGRTVIERETAVMRLVTVERVATERHTWEHTWARSTKAFEIEGEFAVLAGFDLEKPFVVEMDDSGGGGEAGIRIRVAEPEIIAIELRELRILRDEDGLWNKITPGDREEAIAELTRIVRVNALESGVIQRARQLGEQRIREAIDARHGPAEFEYIDLEGMP